MVNILQNVQMADRSLFASVQKLHIEVVSHSHMTQNVLTVYIICSVCVLALFHTDKKADVLQYFCDVFISYHVCVSRLKVVSET